MTNKIPYTCNQEELEVGDWEKGFERYKECFEIKSNPSNYIHVGLNPACQFVDLIGDIRNLLSKADRIGKITRRIKI